MATRLLVATGSATVPVEYTFFYPLQEVAKVMDRFLPSSKQPQQWSRSYNVSQEERRRVNFRRRGSPESKNLEISRSYRQGVTLRAEDLLEEQRLAPINFLNPRQGGDRRTVLGGSATELTKCDRPKAPLRRSSEGNYALRRKSSSSSNAADDPTSSDPSSVTSSSSSSSESGCNGDSETCSYCRLSESSDTYECPDSTDDERSSSSCDNTRRPRLTRALSIDHNTPSKSRPLRRSSPGEYLRHKRDQMEKLRNERLHSPGRKQRTHFHGSDSDSRKQRSSHPVSPSRNRQRPSYRRSVSEEPNTTQQIQRESSSGSNSEGKLETSFSRTNHFKGSDPSGIATLRKSSSRERNGSSVVWNHPADESTPFVTATFSCAVCECDIPFTNCALCSAEQSFGSVTGECDVFASNDSKQVEVIPQDSKDKEELEEFYDNPKPTSSPKLRRSPEERRIQLTSKGKSFNQEEDAAHSERRRSIQLRKYNSEPAPDRETSPPTSRESQSDIRISSTEHPRSESCSSRKSGFHIAKESSRTDDETCRSSCSTTLEDESSMKSRALSPEILVDDINSRKSPNYLVPEFVFEPEIIHKANPLVDEAEVDMLPSAREAFRRLSTDEYLSTVSIHEAAGKGDLHVVKLLTKKDTKQMETVDERGWTPIHLAAAHGHSEVVKYLAGEGAHLSALDPSSYTALHLASMNGHNHVLEVLLPMGVDVDSITAEGFSALHLAVMNGHLECISTLLQWGASLEKRDALGRGVYEMVEEYNLDDVAVVLRKFHKQLHNFKHVLDYMKNRKEDRSTSEIPQEFMDILASIAEESGTE
ncbi:uncharacterized protein [Parasteatoda tepidariorum]